MAHPLAAERSALILAGAVTQGAFEAGALQVLVRHGIAPARVVGASSGALNGVVLAAGLRAGQPVAAADRLATLWRDRASFFQVFAPSLSSLLSMEGLSSSDRVLDLLREEVRPCRSPRAEVELRVVVTALAGTEGSVGGAPATCFERAVTFTGSDFDSAEGLERIFRTVAASAAFPGVFEPVVLAGLGPCVDGGVVDNTPVKLALEGGEARRVFAVVASPLCAPRELDLPRLGLLGHLADALVSERLYRDLREALLINERLRQLDRLVASGVLAPEALEAVKQATGLSGKVSFDLQQIRPAEPLPGNPFSGFFDAALRGQLVDLGLLAAQRLLGPVLVT
jgi:NTE family protein